MKNLLATLNLYAKRKSIISKRKGLRRRKPRSMQQEQAKRERLHARLLKNRSD